nr:hypothetical protein [Lentilactobacillus kisonensis]
MAIQISSELLDGCVLGLLSTNDYYGYALTQKNARIYFSFRIDNVSSFEKTEEE